MATIRTPDTQGGEASLVYAVITHSAGVVALFVHTVVTTLIAMSDAALTGSILPFADYVIAWGKWCVCAYWGLIVACGGVILNLSKAFFKALYTVVSFLVSWIMGFGYDNGSSVRAIAVRAATTGIIVTPNRPRRLSELRDSPKMTDKDKMAAANKPGFDQRPGPLPFPADKVVKRSLAAKEGASFES